MAKSETVFGVAEVFCFFEADIVIGCCAAIALARKNLGIGSFGRVRGFVGVGIQLEGG